MTPDHSRHVHGIVRSALLFALVAMAAAPIARAQTLAHDSTRSGPTRPQLEALAVQLEHEAQTTTNKDVRAEKQAQAAMIRERLRDGDCQVGDRVAVLITGDTVIADTVAVRAGRTLQLPNFPPLSLQGVLHSELDSALTQQISRYLKNPHVEATPLLQVAVLGPVGHPGFFSVPTDMTLTDVIMMAGGPGQGSDVNKTVVRRGGKVIESDKVVRQAFASGTTLDELNLRAGDQIVVGEKANHDWFRILSVVSLAAGTAVSIYYITHR